MAAVPRYRCGHDGRPSFVCDGRLGHLLGETLEDYQFAFDTMDQYYRQQKTTLSFM